MNNTRDPVRCLRTLVHTGDTRVAEFEMAPHSAGEIHRHSSASEYCLCLQGRLEVAINDSPGRSLQPGDRLNIPAGTSHQVRNPGAVPCRYLVVQYGGAHDFITGQRRDAHT